MTLRSADVRSDADVRQWEERLNRQWPQRAQVSDWIAQRVAEAVGQTPRLVELACGAGYLAAVLARQMPGLHCWGFDRSAHLLDFARRRLARHTARPGSQAQVHFRQADLNASDWLAHLDGLGWTGRVDAVVSLQSLHDLGGRAEQAAALRRAHELLRSGGLLVYGDLLLDSDDPHPRRLPADEHTDLLRAAGFAPDVPPLLLGEFGCFGAVK